MSHAVGKLLGVGSHTEPKAWKRTGPNGSVEASAGYLDIYEFTKPTAVYHVAVWSLWRTVEDTLHLFPPENKAPSADTISVTTEWEKVRWDETGETSSDAEPEQLPFEMK